jgi:radical SAM protein with 4Fe4S-binding SPASM domain
LKKFCLGVNIDIMKNVNVSEYLHYAEVDKDIYIGWNRFLPSIFILNKAALSLLDKIEKKTPIEMNENIARFFEEAEKHKFLHEGETDPSREEFFNMVHRELDEMDRRAGDFYREEKDYDSLKIGNDNCNLACSYCVNEFEMEALSGNIRCSGKKPKRTGKLRIIEKCVDQFFSRKVKNGVPQTKVFFNGGEILVDWPLVKKTVERISKNYPGIKVEYSINTNLTLLNEEIAEFFNRHNFTVHISIDGYKEAHDKTRVYRNKKGSFDDIIEKVELYRKYDKKNSMIYYQGTIEYPDEFKPGEVYKMNRYGFSGARLAPNLLNSSEEDARKKARLMGKFLELNAGNEFEVTELIFTRAKNKINQNEYRFALNCQGLGSAPKPDIEINITTLSVSHLCGFIRKASVPFKELRYDIYNPVLWDVSSRFTRERMDSVMNNCLECPLVGICVGGCILSGIDGRNRLNKAACAYQNEMWEIYIKKVYEDRKKKKS